MRLEGRTQEIDVLFATVKNDDRFRTTPIKRDPVIISITRAIYMCLE